MRHRPRRKQAGLIPSLNCPKAAEDLTVNEVAGLHLQYNALSAVTLAPTVNDWTRHVVKLLEELTDDCDTWDPEILQCPDITTSCIKFETVSWRKRHCVHAMHGIETPPGLPTHVSIDDLKPRMIDNAKTTVSTHACQQRQKSYVNHTSHLLLMT